MLRHDIPDLYAPDLNPGLHPLAPQTPALEADRAPPPPQDLVEARDGDEEPRGSTQCENPSGPTLWSMCI